MKIAFLTNYFPKLSETFIMNQAIGLINRGHDIRIFALGPADENVIHGDVKEHDLLEKTIYFKPPANYTKGSIEVIRLAIKYPELITEIIPSLLRGSEGGIRLSTLLQFQQLKNPEFDICHAHFGPAAKRWDFIPKMKNTPYIVSFYGGDASHDVTEKPKTYQQVFDNADMITALSENMREDLVAAGAPREKTVIQSLPIDIEQFEYSPSKFSEGDPIEVLTVARFTEKKGLDDALEAIDLVSKDYDIRWTIAGDGELRQSFEKEVHKRGLEDIVEILGWVKQERVRELLTENHIFLLPSKTSSIGDKEGTPTVLLEAQACGVPIISTYHAGIPSIVSDGEAGTLVPENNPEKLADALRELVTSPDSWGEMGRHGREYVQEFHSIDAVAEGLEQIYENI